MSLFQKLRLKRAQRALVPISNAINDNVQRQFDQLFQICGEEQTKILYTKWRFAEAGWSPGDIVPRPRSTEEFAERFIEQLGGGTIEHAREFDASMVEAFASMVESPFGQLYFQFLAVPIDQAQSWWDGKYSETATTDGKLKR